MADKGNHRSTRIVMFESAEYQELPPDAKLVLLTMKHNRLTNMAGIFSFQSGELYTVVDHTGLDIDRVNAALDILEQQNWIIRSSRILWIRNQLLHDPGIRLSNIKHLQGILNVVNNLPDEDIVHEFCKQYNLYSLWESKVIAYGKQDKEEDKDKDKEEEAPPIDRFNKWMAVKKNRLTVDQLASSHKLSKSTAEKEIGKMKPWMIANPKKANKKNWSAFINNWFQKKAEDDLKNGKSDDYTRPPS